MIDEKTLGKWKEKIIRNGAIDPELYTRYNVKRGLRNTDGSGVVVGMTQVGEVHAYIMSEGEKIPVDGELTYWGYDVQDLAAGFRRDKRYGFEETCYLLLFGELPGVKELTEFKKILA